MKTVKTCASPGCDEPRRPGNAARYCVEHGQSTNKSKRYYDAHQPLQCERAMTRNNEWKRRLGEIKLAAGCKDCGYREHAVALDFDHVFGPKEIRIGSTRSSWDKILLEIAKCEVVCANCHRVRTARRGQWDANQ